MYSRCDSWLQLHARFNDVTIFILRFQDLTGCQNGDSCQPNNWAPEMSSGAYPTNTHALMLNPVILIKHDSPATKSKTEFHILGSSVSSVPSSCKNRSGMNIDGSWYFSGSWSIALNHGTYEQFEKNKLMYKFTRCSEWQQHLSEFDAPHKYLPLSTYGECLSSRQSIQIRTSPIRKGLQIGAIGLHL